MSHKAFDARGTEILPHMLFLYAQAVGSSVRLSWGVVVDVPAPRRIRFQAGPRYSFDTTPLRSSTLYSPENLVVLSWADNVPPEVRARLDPDGAHARALNQAPAAIA